MAEDIQEEVTEPSGEVTHYYGKPMVAVVKLTERVRNGDRIKVKGATTDFTMTVQGMRNEEEQEIDEAAAGELVAFKTPDVARPGDKIWLIMREVESE